MATMYVSNSTVYADSSVGSVNGTNTDDTIIYDSYTLAAFMYIWANDGNDTIKLNVLQDHVTIDGGAGSDTIDISGLSALSPGQAYYINLNYVDPSNNVLTPKLILTDGITDLKTVYLNNVENIIGSQGAEFISGNNGNNIIDGYKGNDYIYGLGGNDTFLSSDFSYTTTATGNQFNSSATIFGGDGLDTISYENANNVWSLNIDLTTGYTTVSGFVNVKDHFESIENVVGSNGNDVINGNYLGNFINGKTGYDVIHGLNGNDTIISAGTGSLYGDSGNDTLIFSGTWAINLYGGDGNDTLINNSTSLHDVYLQGGAGNDEFIINTTGPVRVYGYDEWASSVDNAIDTVNFSNLSVSISVDLINKEASTGNNNPTFAYLFNIENVTGTNFNDMIYGNDLNNVLLGLSGNDDLRGKIGDDILIGGAGDDRLDGGNGVDTVSYLDAVVSGIIVNLAAGTQTSADAFVGNDTLISIENIIGTNFKDTITGDSNTNRLEGRGGDDTFIWSLGNDILDGGTGNDTVTAAGASTGALMNWNNMIDIEKIVGSNFNDVISGIKNTTNLTLTGVGGKDKFSFDLNNYNLANAGQLGSVKVTITDFATNFSANAATTKDLLEFDVASGVSVNVSNTLTMVNGLASNVVKVNIGVINIAEITLQGTSALFSSADYTII